MAPFSNGTTASEEPEYFIGKGLSESMADRYEEALDILMQGFRKYPENLEIQFFLIRTTGEAARARNEPGLIREVITVWDQFIAAHPDEKFSVSRSTANAYIERGILKRALGDPLEAQMDFCAAQEIDPGVILP